MIINNINSPLEITHWYELDNKSINSKKIVFTGNVMGIYTKGSLVPNIAINIDQTDHNDIETILCILGIWVMLIPITEDYLLSKVNLGLELTELQKDWLMDKLGGKGKKGTLKIGEQVIKCR